MHKTITRIENKLAVPRVLAHCTYMLRSLERSVQQRVAIALARHVAPGGGLAPIFVDKAGLDVLLALVTEPPNGTPGSDIMHRDGAAALLHLAVKVNATAPIHAMWVTTALWCRALVPFLLTCGGLHFIRLQLWKMGMVLSCPGGGLAMRRKSSRCATVTGFSPHCG